MLSIFSTLITTCFSSLIFVIVVLKPGLFLIFNFLFSKEFWTIWMFDKKLDNMSVATSIDSILKLLTSPFFISVCVFPLLIISIMYASWLVITLKLLTRLYRNVAPFDILLEITLNTDEIQPIILLMLIFFLIFDIIL